MLTKRNIKKVFVQKKRCVLLEKHQVLALNTHQERGARWHGCTGNIYFSTRFATCLYYFQVKQVRLHIYPVIMICDPNVLVFLVELSFGLRMQSRPRRKYWICHIKCVAHLNLVHKPLTCNERSMTANVVPNAVIALQKYIICEVLSLHRFQCFSRSEHMWTQVKRNEDAHTSKSTTFTCSAFACCSRVSF